MGEIAPEEEFLLLSLPDVRFLCLDQITRFSLRDKHLFKIIEVDITRVDCITYNFDR